MDQPETNEVLVAESAQPITVAAASRSGVGPVERREGPPALLPTRSGLGPLSAQMGPAPCPTCGGPGMQGGAAAVAASCVYALGQIEARFPRLSVEKEMAQATGRAETAGRTDQQAFYQVLSQRENRYLARQMCWVLTI